MKKVFRIGCILGMVVLFSACTTLQYFSFERLQAADVSFPEQVRSVGVVNGVPSSSGGDGKVAAEAFAEEIAAAHKNADIHIHDLSMLTGYCAGWSLKQLIQEGLGGVTGKITSAPASHLATLCNQMVNFLGIMQNEWAGAQAFSSFDTYLAPFVKVDNLTYEPLADDAEPALAEGYYRFVDESDNAIFVYISPYADFANLEMPTSKLHIQGVLYYESVGGGLGKQFVIRPRFADDITNL